ncbi:glycosyltransferase family 2 protein [Bacillus sp. H8-1]|nr:glycosyltransferase family 2 protein [Bacillus sp. H8-1]
MEETMRVSVIIPTFNRPVLLNRAINSVLNQTYKNVEVIVVDDNNPGTIGRLETEEVMQEYSNNCKVRYIKHSTNKNGAAARNTGIENSSGEIICFLDDDDYFLEQKVEKQLNYLKKNTNFQGVYCGRIQKGKYIKPIKSGDLSKEILSLSFTPTTCSLMFYKYTIEEIKGFDESFKRHQDFEFLLKFFKKYKLGFVEEALVVIGENVGENSLHGKELEKMKENFLSTFQVTLDSLNKKERKKIYCIHYSRVFWDHVKCRYKILAFKIFLKYFLKYPIHFTKSNCAFLISYFKKKRSVQKDFIVEKKI